MSYKDDEETIGEVDINEDEADVLLSPDDLDEPLDDDLLIDEELIIDGEEEDEEDLVDFAGLDGSEY